MTSKSQGDSAAHHAAEHPSEEAVGLAEWAAGLLARTDPTEQGRLDPTQTVPIKLTAARRALLLEQNLVARELHDELDIAGEGTRTVKLTLQQWCDICFALAEGILKADERRKAQLSLLGQKIADGLLDHLKNQGRTGIKPLVLHVDS